ncbi:MAG: PAS domain-containing protein, partial [Eubacteriales bacterium]
MAALILLVFYCDIPNPNMILIAGLVLCSALYGYGGGIVAAVIMFGYTLFFFSTDHSFTRFTPQNTQKVIVSIVGIVADMLFVCALKRAEIREFNAFQALNAALQSKAASFDTLHEMLGSGRWTMDFNEEGVMVGVNWSKEFRRMLGYQSEEDFPDVLESWSDLLHPDDKERVLKEFYDTISDYTGQKIYDVEYRLLTKDRGYRWYRAVGKPTRRPDGTPVTYVGVFIDITERKETAQSLSAARRMADIDPLTGVKNKNAYFQWEKKIDAAIEEGEQEPFAVAVFDINDLKKVNDLYGHKEG